MIERAIADRAVICNGPENFRLELIPACGNGLIMSPPCLRYRASSRGRRMRKQGRRADNARRGWSAGRAQGPFAKGPARLARRAGGARQPRPGGLRQPLAPSRRSIPRAGKRKMGSRLTPGLSKNRGGDARQFEKLFGSDSATVSPLPSPGFSRRSRSGGHSASPSGMAGTRSATTSKKRCCRYGRFALLRSAFTLLPRSASESCSSCAA